MPTYKNLNTTKNNKKNFILDTNVILHDYKCIYNFQENDIYIPIVVLEELDKFKKGNEEIFAIYIETSNGDFENVKQK